MMLPLSETIFGLAGTVLDQLLHLAEGVGAMLLAFLVGRLEFVAHNPTSAITGLMANVFIVWWLFTTAERSASSIIGGSRRFESTSRAIPGL
jgi:hypothetical protein